MRTRWQLTEFDSTGELRRSVDLNEANKIWQHDWVLAHRVQLHDTLKRVATSPDGQGIPVELLLDRRVVDVDPIQASIEISDGSIISGDVVIGADGVRSACRRRVPGGDVQAFGSGKSAFRFMFKRDAALADPVTAKLVQRPGELLIWYSSDRRVVIYPTSDNSLMNFVCIHPESESNAGNEWSTTSSPELLLQVYRNFPVECRAMLSKAEPDTIKSWKLLDMKVLPTFVHERLALIGDAAHPFLPHQGQGAGVAIEDGAALSVFLERGLRRDEVPDRIRLYQETRYTRACRIQQYSRLAGRDLTEDERAAFDSK